MDTFRDTSKYVYISETQQLSKYVCQEFSSHYFLPLLPAVVGFEPFHLGMWVNFCFQWVETNQSNFRIYPTDIRLSPHHGSTLTAIQMLNTDVCGC